MFSFHKIVSYENSYVKISMKLNRLTKTIFNYQQTSNVNKIYEYEIK